MTILQQSTKRAVLYARVSTEAQATDDKTSLSEQLLALRKYADSHGYKIVEEIPEEISGRKQDTEGLERIRDLAESGEIDAVLVYKWNRLARTVARFETFMLEMKLAGVEVISLDGQSNATPSGRMFNRLMAVFSEYQRDDLVETMQQGKRGTARAGKIVPGRFAPYGFEYDRVSRSYLVDESRMRHVRRLFRMVGVEGAALWAVKRTFDAEGVPTTRGGRYWHVTTLRDMILNDAYVPHTYEELEALVDVGNLSPDVLATLDPNAMNGIQWYNRHKIETVPGERQIKTMRPRDEWIAVPVPDSGIPREHVEAARAAIQDNVRPSDAGRRYWNLKGLAYCPCGARLTPHTVTKKGGPRFYYICHAHRSGREPCPYAKYHAAEDLEERVGGFVLELIRNPDTLRDQFEAEAAREKAALRDQRKYIAALASRLAEVESERDRLVRLYTRGKLTDDEYDAYTEELAERKKSAEEELTKLEDAQRYIEYLDMLPAYIEDFLRELPDETDYVPRIREYVTEKMESSDTYILPDEAEPTLEPGKFRRCTPEEMEQLRKEAERKRAERYRRVYEKLNLKVVAYPEGDLEISWTGGVRKLSCSRR
jgi:site-specific DNA recombinase